MAGAGLKDLSLDPKEAKEMVEPHAPDAPLYPYGLQITLNADTLKKLGIKKLPQVGQYMSIVGYCCVKGVSSNETQGGEAESRVELQIEAADIKPVKKGGPEERLYDGPPES